MKTLILNNGQQFEVNDNSNNYEISMTVNTATMKQAVEEITENNLKHATMGDITFLNTIVNGINMSTPNKNGEVNIIFSLGEKSELEIMRERLDEQDMALMELAEMIIGG